MLQSVEQYNNNPSFIKFYSADKMYIYENFKFLVFGKGHLIFLGGISKKNISDPVFLPKKSWPA